MADSTADVNRELTQLEAEIKKLEVEYNMYFSGRLARPPWETRSRVDGMVKRLDRSHIGNYALRFRFTTLQTRFNRFLDLWDRALRAREEGRQGPLSHLAPQKEPPKPAPVEDRILRVATFRDPIQEEDKVRELYKSFIEARQEVGQERVDFSRFAQLVSTRPSSSIAMPSEMKSISRPPRLRGPVMPISPACPIFGMMSWVGSCSTMSHSRTYGAISRCAKSRTYARKVSCSSLKEKSSAIVGFLKGMDLQVVRTS